MQLAPALADLRCMAEGSSAGDGHHRASAIAASVPPAATSNNSTCTLDSGQPLIPVQVQHTSLGCPSWYGSTVPVAALPGTLPIWCCIAIFLRGAVKSFPNHGARISEQD